MDPPHRSGSRKRTYSTSARQQPSEHASRSQRPGDSVEHGTMLSDTPPVAPVKRARAEKTPPRSTLQPAMMERPASAPVEDKLQADAEAQRSSELLEGFRKDLEAIRHTLTCKICTRLFFEPYTTPCGHTYCYSCLNTWFTSSMGRKSCPDCRAPIRSQPAPAYALRDMISVYLARSELYPPNETLESLQETKQEEAEIVQRDRDNQDPRSGGLFKGVFKPGRAPQMPIRDAADGVDRCPACHWELEDGNCAHCGYSLDIVGLLGDMDEDSNFSDAETDDFLDAPNAADWFDGEEQDLDLNMRGHLVNVELAHSLAHRQAYRGRRGPRPNLGHRVHPINVGHPRPMPMLDESDAEDEDDDDDGSLTSGFIDDADEIAPEPSAPTARGSSEQRRPVLALGQRRLRRVIESESEASNSDHEYESEVAEDELSFRSLGRRSATPGSLSRVSATSSAGRDDETDDTDDENDYEYDDLHADVNVTLGGFSPLANDDIDFENMEMHNEPTYDDTDDESVNFGLAGLRSTRRSWRADAEPADRPSRSCRRVRGLDQVGTRRAVRPTIRFRSPERDPQITNVFLPYINQRAAPASRVMPQPTPYREPGRDSDLPGARAPRNHQDLLSGDLGRRRRGEDIMRHSHRHDSPIVAPGGPQSTPRRPSDIRSSARNLSIRLSSTGPGYSADDIIRQANIRSPYASNLRSRALAPDTLARQSTNLRPSRAGQRVSMTTNTSSASHRLPVSYALASDDEGTEWESGRAQLGRSNNSRVEQMRRLRVEGFNPFIMARRELERNLRGPGF